MKKKLIACAVLVAASLTAFSQVGIGTITPKGVLDVASSDSGIIVPRVLNTAAVTTPANGMIIYDLSSNCFRGYQGGEWSDCGIAQSRTAVSNTVLAQIGNEADNPDSVNSVVSIAQLNQILPTISGVDVSKERDYQNYIDAYPDKFASPATQAEVQAMVNELNNLASNNSVISSTGKIWLDRNLGASQVATSPTDAAAYGDLYQWGRTTDGHEKRSNSVIIAGPVSSGSEGSNFISNNGTSPFDWLNSQDGTRWNGATKGIHDPCPTGFRVPTEAELHAEHLLFPTDNSAGAFGSVLKLTIAGERDRRNGVINNIGYSGSYWSSTVGGTGARLLFFGSNIAYTSSNVRAFGFSVRCLKE